MQHLEGQLKGTGPERDFLAEATSLALQLDPVSWEFDFSDRDFDDIAEITEGQKSCISNSALPKDATQRDQLISANSYNWYSLHRPKKIRTPLQNGDFEVEHQSSSSNSAGEADCKPSISLPEDAKASSLENSNLKARERSRALQRRLRYRDKKEQRKRLEAAEYHLEVIQREKAAIEAHADVLEKALMKISQESITSQSQTAECPTFIPSLGWTNFDPHGSIVLAAIFDQPRKLTRKEASTISLRDHARIWTEYVARARDCLQKADLSKGADCEYLKKLKALLDERHGFLCWTSANNLSIIHKLSASNLESDPPRPNLASPQRFSDVLKKLKLTDQQSTALLKSRSSYLLSIGYHSASLARLQSQILSIDPTPHESLRNSSYLRWTETSRALQETVEEMHLSHVRLHFDIYFGKQALTPYQAGTLLVECFPYTPDLIALVKELAIAQKAPSSQELLSKGASRYAEKQGAADIKAPPEPYRTVVDKVGDLIGKVKLWDDQAE